MLSSTNLSPLSSLRVYAPASKEILSCLSLLARTVFQYEALLPNVQLQGQLSTQVRERRLAQEDGGHGREVRSPVILQWMCQHIHVHPFSGQCAAVL